jgi:hypothetical protein
VTALLIHSHPPNAARECDHMVRLRGDLLNAGVPTSAAASL